GGEDSEGNALAQPLVARLGQRHRRADQHALEEPQPHAGPAGKRMSPKSSPTAHGDRADMDDRRGFLRNLNAGGRSLNGGLNPEDATVRSEVDCGCATRRPRRRGDRSAASQGGGSSMPPPSLSSSRSASSKSRSRRKRSG